MIWLTRTGLRLTRPLFSWLETVTIAGMCIMFATVSWPLWIQWTVAVAVTSAVIFTGTVAGGFCAGYLTGAGRLGRRR